MLIDTHAHLNFPAFKDDYEEVIKKCFDEKIGMINVGAEGKSSDRAVKLAEQYEGGVWAAVGLHPTHLVEQVWIENIRGEQIEYRSKAEEFHCEKYKELAQRKKVIAIGEIGLDFHHLTQNLRHRTKEKDQQKKIFREQIKLAVELNLPVIIHCREAYMEMLEILIEEKKQYGPKLRGVMHSYLGRLSYAQEFNNLGFLLGFNGIITFARDYDKVLREISLENILLETDCPWLAPIPFRGRRNEPIYVKYVAEKIAEIKNVSMKNVSTVTTTNAEKLFNISLKFA